MQILVTQTPSAPVLSLFGHAYSCVSNSLSILPTLSVRSVLVKLTALCLFNALFVWSVCMVYLHGLCTSLRRLLLLCPLELCLSGLLGLCSP